MAKNARAAEDPPADSFERLIREMEKMPGVGRRSAERMAYHLLEVSRDEAMTLAVAIRDVKDKLRPCEQCGNLTEQPRCAVCVDVRRNGELICVVEWPRDIRAIEKSGSFRGLYHVLMGRLSPLSGIEPEDLNIDRLLARVKDGAVREVVLATSPSMEGDATARFVMEQVRRIAPQVQASRLARGIPEGSELGFAQSGTIGEAIKGRRRMD